MDIEVIFAEVLGRSPTDAERLFLQRLAASWDVRGNEALLAVLFVLQFGAGWQRYPARCAESVRHAVRAALRRDSVPPATSRLHLQPRLGPWLALRAAAFVAIVGTAITSLLLGAAHTLQPSTLLGHSRNGPASFLDASPPVAISASALPPLCLVVGRRLRRLKGLVLPRRPTPPVIRHSPAKQTESRSP